MTAYRDKCCDHQGKLEDALAKIESMKKPIHWEQAAHRFCISLLILFLTTLCGCFIAGTIAYTATWIHHL